jgi:hydroxyacylglutathione hydrolase
MRKPVKNLFIILGVVVALVVVVVIGSVVLKAQSELKKMHALPTKLVVETVFAINNGTVNMYLIKDSDRYVAIDAGTDKKGIEKGLKQLHIAPEKVKAVLLTHTDFDHVAALSLFQNAELRFAKEEEQMINGKTTRTFGITHNTIDRTHYTLIDDGQTFTLGHLTVKGILTPGHTTGSMCYLINNRLLFIGDALSLKDGEVAPFNKFFNRDNDQAIRSIAQITGLPGVAYIFTAHYGYGNYAKAVKGWNGVIK